MHGIGWRLVLAAAVGAAVLTGMFLVAEAFGPRWLLEPERWQRSAGVGVAIATIALLAADVVLPVPSSVVMMASGAVFGVPLGSLIAVTGLTAGAIIGYALGRSACPLARRLLGEATRDLEALVQRRGVLAVVVLRPVPIVAELTVLAAGSARLPFPRFLVAAAVGSAVTGICFAGVGATDVGLPGAVPTLVAGGAWLVGTAIMSIRTTSLSGRAGRA